MLTLMLPYLINEQSNIDKVGNCQKSNRKLPNSIVEIPKFYLLICIQEWHKYNITMVYIHMHKI